MPGSDSIYSFHSPFAVKLMNQMVIYSLITVRIYDDQYLNNPSASNTIGSASIFSFLRNHSATEVKLFSKSVISLLVPMVLTQDYRVQVEPILNLHHHH